MILTGQQIQERNIMAPFSYRTKHNGMTYGLGPAGYDIRVREANVLYPGDFWLCSSVEQFTMPNNVLAIVHDKSTWARRGLALQNTVIEPGWLGHLTMEISNHSRTPVIIAAGDPIAQIIFHETAGECVPYAGKYQNQPPKPVGPIEDRERPVGMAEPTSDSFRW